MLAAEPVTVPSFPFNLSDMFNAATGSRHLAVAVSGGSDSLALLHLATQWGISGGVKVSAITVDHGLRSESGQEAMKVSTWASKLGVAHVTLAWLGEKPRSGLQAAARQVRYDLMTQWCRDNGADCLLTGHTMNDQAETVAMRLKRTDTAESISGIRPEIIWNQIKVLRPLLQVKREALRDWLRGEGHCWIDDPSNDNRSFERVRVRQALNSEDIDSLAHRATLAQMRTSETEAAALQFASQHVVTHREGYFSVKRDGLVRLDDDTADTLIRMMLRSVGGDEALRDERRRLWSWITSATGSRRTLGGVILTKRKRDIMFLREPARIDSSVRPVLPGQTLVWDKRFEIFGAGGFQVAAACKIAGLKSIPGLPRLVFDGLPAIVGANGLAELALDKPHSGVSLRFLGLR